MGTTLITVAGQMREVRGTYDDVKATLAARRLSADDGLRTFVKTDGEEITVAAGAVAMIEPLYETERRKVGFC